MNALIFWATISIFFSFLCSVLEAVLLSVTPTFINVKKQEGKDYALTLEKLKRDVDKPLIAILTLNTIAHTLGAMMVGIEAENLPYKIELWGINTVGIVSAIMTFLILVASEIIPKTIGATYWEALANFASKALTVLIFPLKWTGILWLLQLTTKLIGGKGHGSVLTREGFVAMTEVAHEEGVFQENESKIIKNLLNFKEIFAKDVMTPRTVMKTEDETNTVKDFFNKNLNIRFSRIPVYTDETDNITGLVLKDEIFKEMALGNKTTTLAELKRDIIVVNRNLPIPTLFEKLIESRNHMALVVDEYGSVSGLVTMEDVIETLLGLEIMDESDNVSDLQSLARKSWEARAKKLGILGEDKPEK
ncbi:CNNM domain-containing protein [Jejuia pallidilutea]|jgi:CBS domain containing-hemolysin-like protein|uniref:CBS domain containing-hemolysin-like protein n=1 Tax=Jejuia pallidilutea TaxID=504487 RepID=A0A090VKC9_9FLAO|nr:hemolysin family protein [Jejuia pallidilutea]PQV45273.1 CBS domain containing-hemolysin-like protein [Jejuia pallidilutea]GAL65220.1 magnesium and cobalt efflux protein CorC [Jejuia pallidilutea]GAL69272.1 magnesium and cobalt efflux protein CorC [Jejuia pallidilutea]GAL89185.1 magnesium and cobalt efflux protein CorC [Jejuia pallidilutea]